MKKGVRCWFLFLVVAIIFSSLVISEEFAPKTYQALGFYFEECGSVEGCESLDLVPVYSYCEQSIPLDEDGDEWACQTEDPIGAECDGNLIEYQESPLGSGCIVYSELENWDGIFDADNPCDSTKLSVGFNIDSNSKSTTERADILGEFINDYSTEIDTLTDGLTDDYGIGDIFSEDNVFAGIGGLVTEVFNEFGDIVSGAVGWVDGASDEWAYLPLAYSPYTSKSSKGILCGGDNLWHECNAETVDKMYWAPLSLEVDSEQIQFPMIPYKCVNKNNLNIYNWEIAELDLDADGYSISQDCSDIPVLDGSCPIPEIEDYQYKTIEEIRASVKEKCVGVVYAGCPICVNPRAPEICGDEINNDCRGDGIDFNGAVDNLDGETSDNCDNFKEGCEKPIEAYLMNGEQYINEEGEVISSDAEIQMLPRAYNNIYDEQFSWIDTGTVGDGQGECCGYGGLNDLGDIYPGRKNTESPNQDFICLKDDPDLVGVGVGNVKTYLSSTGTTDAWSSCSDADDSWCFVSASGIGAPQFKILTIKPLGQQPYDVVSDSKGWQKCDGTNNFNQPMRTPVSTDPLNPFDSSLNPVVNSFYCYQEGDHYSWAECHPGGEYVLHNPGLKGREAGDGLYTLKSQTPSTNPLEVNFNAIPLATFYGEGTYLNFKNYNRLGFYFKFKSSTGYLSEDELTLPAGLMLNILGPADSDGNAIVYLQKDVLGDIQSRPFFSSEDDEWMHVETTIPDDLAAVSQIKITPLPANSNGIEVKNPYLSESTGSNALVCSGQASLPASQSNWLTSFDEYRGVWFDAKDMCQKRYGNTAWQEEYTPIVSDHNCCGNNANEYYTGNEVTLNLEGARDFTDTGKHYACWNSQVIQQDTTIMNVEAEVVYKEVGESFNFDDLAFNMAITDSPDPIDFELTKMNIIALTDLTSTPEHTLTLENPRSILYPGGLVFNPETKMVKLMVLGTLFELISGSDEFIKKNPSLSLINLRTGDLLSSTSTVNGMEFTIRDDAGNLLINDPIGVLAELDVDEYFAADVERSNAHTPTFFPLNYPCASPECLFPLPGGDAFVTELPDDLPEDFVFTPPIPENTLYLLRNPHPDLYDLYFVPSNTEAEWILLTPEPQAFSEKGNLLAKRVAQQVLYVNKENDDTTPDVDETALGFFGCEAADYVDNGVTAVDSTYYNPSELCTVQGNWFCSPSLADKKDDGSVNKSITTINSWSPESVYRGYKEPTDPEFDISTLSVEAFDDALELFNAEGDTKIQPSERKSISSAVSGQNLLPNALFQEIDSNKLFYWELLNSFGTPFPVRGIFSTIGEDSTNDALKLTSGFTLRSDRIAVPSDRWLYFSMEEVKGDLDDSIITCNGENVVSLKLYDKDGEAVTSEQSEPTLREFPFSEGSLDVSSEIYVSLDSSTGTTTRITKNFETTSINTGTASYVVVEFSSPTGSGATDCYIRHPMLQLLDLPGSTTPIPDDVPFAFFTYDNRYKSADVTPAYPRSAQSCCSADSCWNGYACIASMSDTLLAEPFDTSVGKKYYRCVAGEWTDLPLLHDWNYDKSGFCQSNNQCFVVNSNSDLSWKKHEGVTEVVANRTEEGVTDKEGFTQQELGPYYLPNCINSTEYLFDHYCMETNWSSRTKILAEQLLEYADDDDYTLYCTTPKKAVLDTPNLEGAFAPYIIGGATETTVATATPESTTGIMPSSVSGTDTKDCFPMADQPAEVNRLLPNENTCVNNFCILKKKNGDETKTIIATTLNKPVDDSNTFIKALDEGFVIMADSDPEQKPCYTAETDKATVDCNVPEGSSAGLQYLPTIEAVIYGKEGIEDDLTWDEAMDLMIAFIKDFLGIEDESEAIALLESHLNVRELYSLRADDKTASVIKENLVKDDDILLWAEYTGFKTPLCKFVKSSQLPEGFVSDITADFQRGLPGVKIFSCFGDESKQQVVLRVDESEKDVVDWLFPQLSGKLRVEETD